MSRFSTNAIMFLVLVGLSTATAYARANSDAHRQDKASFDVLTTLSSPDTGVTRFTYDPAGNLSIRLDARNINATYRYDAANRLTSVIYPDEPLTYGYDEATGGAGAKGRLTTLGDGSGRTRYVYDAHGRVLQKTQQLGADSNAAGRKTLGYSYAGGRIDETVLPSGTRLRYRRPRRGDTPDQEGASCGCGLRGNKGDR